MSGPRVEPLTTEEREALHSGGVAAKAGGKDAMNNGGVDSGSDKVGIQERRGEAPGTMEGGNGVHSGHSRLGSDKMF